MCPEKEKCNNCQGEIKLFEALYICSTTGRAWTKREWRKANHIHIEEDEK